MNETSNLNANTRVPEGGYKKSGFCLSSWNYGSFYHCNPMYLQKEYLRPNREEREGQGERSKSLVLNKYGKVNLKPEERIGKLELKV